MLSGITLGWSRKFWARKVLKTVFFRPQERTRRQPGRPWEAGETLFWALPGPFSADSGLRTAHTTRKYLPGAEGMFHGTYLVIL